MAFQGAEGKSQSSQGASHSQTCPSRPLKPAYVVYETFAFLSETPYLLLVFLRALPPKRNRGYIFHVVIEKTKRKEAKGVCNNRRGFYMEA